MKTQSANANGDQSNLSTGRERSDAELLELGDLLMYEIPPASAMTPRATCCRRLSSVQVRNFTSAISSGRTQCTRLRRSGDPKRLPGPPPRRRKDRSG
jgi:hypothetical protein